MTFFEIKDSTLGRKDVVVKDKLIKSIYHHVSNRKRLTVLQGKFDRSDFGEIQNMMGVGGFYIIKNDKAQKHGLKFKYTNTHLIVLRGFHWIGSNNYTKLKKILIKLQIETQLDK